MWTNADTVCWYCERLSAVSYSNVRAETKSENRANVCLVPDRQNALRTEYISTSLWESNIYRKHNVDANEDIHAHNVAEKIWFERQTDSTETYDAVTRTAFLELNIFKSQMFKIVQDKTNSTDSDPCIWYTRTQFVPYREYNSSFLHMIRQAIYV
jgi:hypothetical protein